MSHIPIGQPIQVQDYVSYRYRENPFLMFLINGNRFRAMVRIKKFSASPDWMSPAQLAFILGGAKLNLPFDIDLQDKD